MDRLPYESEQDFALFEEYCGLPRPRKGRLDLMVRPGVTLVLLRGWAERFRWEARAAEYDRTVASISERYVREREETLYAVRAFAVRKALQHSLALTRSQPHDEDVSLRDVREALAIARDVDELIGRPETPREDVPGSAEDAVEELLRRG